MLKNPYFKNRKPTYKKWWPVGLPGSQEFPRNFSPKKKNVSNNFSKFPMSFCFFAGGKKFFPQVRKCSIRGPKTLTIIGVIIFPTQKIHYSKRNPSKLPYICIIWSVQNGPHAIHHFWLEKTLSQNGAPKHPQPYEPEVKTTSTSYFPGKNGWNWHVPWSKVAFFWGWEKSHL